MMKLHGYWRSSASYRVRIALNLKSIEVEHIPVNLKDGEQHSDAFSELSSQALVPVLELENGECLSQSLAIMEYLEALQPSPALLPGDEILRQKVRAGALMISADTAPIQNLRVLKYLKSELNSTPEQVSLWAKHWIALGLSSLETLVSAKNYEEGYLFSSEPGLAECCLIPQLYNARRFGVDVSDFPRLVEVEKNCLTHDAFKRAAPEEQDDAN